MTIKDKKYQLVELVKPVTVVAAGSKIYFQDQPQLRSIINERSVFIKGIEAYCVEDCPVSWLTTNPVAPVAAFLNAALVLNVDGYEDFNLIPLASLRRIQTAAGVAPTVQDLFQFKNLWRVDWTKSYLQFAAAPAAATFSYLFGVYYDYYPDLDDLRDQEIIRQVVLAAKNV